MNRKQLMDPDAGSALMRREGGLAHSLPGETEEPVPNVFGSVWRRRWSVLTITVFFVVGAVVFLRIMPPSYTAVAQLTIDPPQRLPQLTGVTGANESGDNYLWTQIAVMLSPSVCGDAAKTLRPTATEDELHDFTNQLRGTVTSDVGRRDSVITLTYTDKRRAVDAANNVNAVVQAYIKYMTKSHGDTSHALLDVLQAKRNEYGEQLNRERDAEIDFRKQHPRLAFTSTGGANVVTTTLDKLFADKATKIVDLSQATASYNAADQLRDDLPRLQQFALSLGFTTPSTTSEIAQTQQLLSQAQMQLLMFKGAVGTQNPNFVRAQNIVTEMTAKLQILSRKFADEFLGSLGQAKVLAEEKVKAIDEQIKLTEVDASAVNTEQGDLMKLLNAEAATTKIVEALDAQINQVQLNTGILSIPNIRILQPASGADASRSPEPSRVLLLTLAVGLAFGIGFALLREKLDQRVRSAEEIAALLGLPVVGVVPHMKRGLTPLARAQAVHWDPMSEVSEAYRAVRTAVHFGVPAGQAHTIVVTSPTPGDGKSTLASNLAISMAQAGKRHAAAGRGLPPAGAAPDVRAEGRVGTDGGSRRARAARQGDSPHGRRGAGPAPGRSAAAESVGTAQRRVVRKHP